MIDNRGDYEWVTIPESIMINGEIMPLRSTDPAAGTRAQRCIRGEDVAFLHEKRCEIRRAIGETDDTTYDLLSRLSFSDLDDLRITNYGWSTLFPNLAQALVDQSSMSFSPVSVAYTYSAPSVDAICSAYPTRLKSLSADDFEAPTFQRGGSLRMDKILALFRDYEKINLFFKRPTSSTSPSTRMTHYVSSSNLINPTNTEVGNGVVYYNHAVRGRSFSTTYPNGYGGTIRFETDETVTFSNGYASACHPFAIVEIEGSASGGYNSRGRYITPLSASQGGNTWTVSGASIVDGAKAAFRLSGIPYDVIYNSSKDGPVATSTATARSLGYGALFAFRDKFDY